MIVNSWVSPSLTITSQKCRIRNLKIWRIWSHLLEFSSELPVTQCAKIHDVYKTVRWQLLPTMLILKYLFQLNKSKYHNETPNFYSDEYSSRIFQYFQNIRTLSGYTSRSRLYSFKFTTTYTVQMFDIYRTFDIVLIPSANRAKYDRIVLCFVCLIVVYIRQCVGVSR